MADRGGDKGGEKKRTGLRKEESRGQVEGRQDGPGKVEKSTTTKMKDCCEIGKTEK